MSEKGTHLETWRKSITKDALNEQTDGTDMNPCAENFAVACLAPLPHRIPPLFNLSLEIISLRHLCLNDFRIIVEFPHLKPFFPCNRLEGVDNTPEQCNGVESIVTLLLNQPENEYNYIFELSSRGKNNFKKLFSP